MTSVAEPVVGRASQSVYEMHASIRHYHIPDNAGVPAGLSRNKI
jgi:hypothetical protein